MPGGRVGGTAFEATRGLPSCETRIRYEKETREYRKLSFFIFKEFFNERRCRRPGDDKITQVRLQVITDKPLFPDFRFAKITFYYPSVF